MIDYKKELNLAQFEAATTLEGPVLVVAGAGSGKTRTIVYRLANLVEAGIPASSILLLTFTRKAAQEMLERARRLLHTSPEPDGYKNHGSMLTLDMASVQGGTFHSFAFATLRRFPPTESTSSLTVMDSHDMLAALQHCRETLKAGKGDRSFPKNQTILSFLSKARNKEMPLEDILRKEAHHLLPHSDTMAQMGEGYQTFKQEKSLLDYDDLLFSLEDVLRTQPEALAYCRHKYQYIMVDEYQDTNPVQARIAALVAGAVTPEAYTVCMGERTIHGSGNIMVVGDDAQSIYAFRGANVRNILTFPDIFPNTKIIRLEENYRSTQPVLNLTNAILENASEGYEKKLFTRKEGGALPNVIRPISDRTQAIIAASRIAELLGRYPACEIAVLFRAAFHSYHLEIQLNKMGIRFRKYGGIRYAEAAHIKDVMSFIRLVQNPLDYTAFSRMAELSRGIGPKTCLRLFQLALAGDAPSLSKALGKHEELAADLAFIDMMRATEASPSSLLAQAVDHYKPRLQLLYPDDHPRRLQGLEQLILIGASYTELDMLIADLSLDDPFKEEEENTTLVLSTIHSSKGLEWSAVLLLDLVEDRLPSRHAMLRAEEFEEERRLMYVACTRAKEHLDIFVPASIYDRGSGGSMPATPSPFVREFSPKLYLEWQEGYTGGLSVRTRNSDAISTTPMQPRAYGAKISYAGPGPRPLRQPQGSATIPTACDDSTQNDETHNETPYTAEPLASLPEAPHVSPAQCGFCHHKVFGRGKVVQHLPPDKYRVNFPGIGLKVIMSAYLTMEE